MKPIELHESAMNFSSLAKLAREKGNEEEALVNYAKAAEIESEVANYYLDKPELEPTRSILVRSAALLNLKAGMLPEAEKFIFWGITNAEDSRVKDQLYEALEISLAYRNLDKASVGSGIDYIYGLRKRSLLYSIEPRRQRHGTAVSLDMISDFTDQFTKSFKAYSRRSYREMFSDSHTSIEDMDEASDDFAELVSPLLTSAGFGSFKFAIASDFLPDFNEDKRVSYLKNNTLIRYHETVFTADLTDDKIEEIKATYTEQEIEEIFRPLSNLKSGKNEYKVSYYDRNSLQKVNLQRISPNQKKALLPPKRLKSEDVGQLETIIGHRTDTGKGSSLQVILRQALKSGNFEYPTLYIDPKGLAPIQLNEEMLINIEFNATIGFTLSYEDLPISSTSTKFPEALNAFYLEFIALIKRIRDNVEKTGEDFKNWKVILRLINNPSGIS